MTVAEASAGVSGAGRVLVTDGEQRAALAVVRSLGRAGWEVGVCAERARALAGASRFARWECRVPDPLSQPAAFFEQVAELARQRRVDLVLPISEAALLAVLPRRDHLAPALVPFPDLATFRRISDKAAVTAAAAGVGIRVPRQIRLDRAPATDPVVPDLRYPIVVKPVRSVGEANGRRLKTGVRYADDPAALDQVLRALPAAAYPVLLQERIVGHGAGVFLLIQGGAVLAAFAHRRLREKPPSGGVSVLRESVALDADLCRRSATLLRGLEWSGVAMVEYKIETATGTPWIMEVNGRFWGSLQLAIDAGVDFPRLLADVARGHVPAPVTTYRVGVRSRWGWGDVDHLLAVWRLTRRGGTLPPETPGRWSALWDFLRAFGPGSRSEVLRLDDPRPFARETLDWLKGR